MSIQITSGGVAEWHDGGSNALMSPQWHPIPINNLLRNFSGLYDEHKKVVKMCIASSFLLYEGE